jgi:hypothetical protein
MVRQAEGRTEVFAEWVERLASYEAAESVPAQWALQQAGAQVIPARAWLVAGVGRTWASCVASKLVYYPNTQSPKKPLEA